MIRRLLLALGLILVALPAMAAEVANVDMPAVARELVH